jgi:translation initiation factor IF-3
MSFPNKFQRGQRPTQKERKHKINSEVRFPQVRLVGDGEPKIMSSYDASKLAESQGLDLILINESQTPPVVRIGDYNKFIYDSEKAEKEKRKNAQKIETKEIQLSCEIHDHDLQTKARKGREFLEDNDKVKVVMQLKGRQKATPERGELVMLKFANILSEVGVPESMPKLEGGRWIMTLKPVLKKK